jgi:cystathionine beta-lyase/cystathionine gamma-synthase
MNTRYTSIDTRLVHAGEPRPLIKGAVTMPVFQSSTFEYGGEEETEDITYIRLNNTPNHRALHEKLAAVEGGESALVTASGMAAVSAALFAALKPGDRLLMQKGVYGGTYAFATRDLKELGIEVDFVDGNDPGSWRKALTPQTKVLYVESIGNPLMEVPALEEAAAFAREYGLMAMIDSTFTSPVNFRPPEHGFDLSIHSCTKYLNGHSDIVAGALIGRRELVAAAARKLVHLGGPLDPHACFLLQRGMKTLRLRVEAQNRGAGELASFLSSHSKITRVKYPGLEGTAGHERARRLFDGFGGMLSFEVRGGADAADELLRRLELPISAPSLGGVESLITRPATTSHASMNPEARRAQGISDALIRYSVGIEAPADLIADLRQALEQL